MILGFDVKKFHLRKTVNPETLDQETQTDVESFMFCPEMEKIQNFPELMSLQVMTKHFLQC